MSKKPIFEPVLRTSVHTLTHSEPEMIVDLEPKPIKIYRVIANPINHLTQELWLRFELLDKKTKESIEIDRFPFKHTNTLSITDEKSPTPLMIGGDHPLHSKTPLLITPGYDMKISIQADGLKKTNCFVTLYIEARCVA